MELTHSARTSREHVQPKSCKLWPWTTAFFCLLFTAPLRVCRPGEEEKTTEQHAYRHPKRAGDAGNKTPRTTHPIYRR